MDLGKWQLERLRYKSQVNIKMDLRETGRNEVIDCTSCRSFKWRVLTLVVFYEPFKVQQLHECCH
jgi:hypothetical protein